MTVFGRGFDIDATPTMEETNAYVEHTEKTTQVFVVGFIFAIIGAGVYGVGARQG